MANFIVYPTSILGKQHVRTPTQAQSLSSRYVFLNLINAEPNLGAPPYQVSGATYSSSVTSNENLGIRYALLSNNHSGSAWRVWAYDNPKIATYSKEGSIAIGDNAFPINTKSFVYSNYAYDNQNNRFNSQSFSDKSFNVFSLSGIYLFNGTTIGDPASAVEFIVTESGKVGIGVEDPAEKLTVNGNISANGNFIIETLSAKNSLIVDGNTILGNDRLDTLTITGSTVSIPNGLDIDNGVLYVSSLYNNVNIGSSNPGPTALNVTGAINVTSNYDLLGDGVLGNTTANNINVKGEKLFIPDNFLIGVSTSPGPSTPVVNLNNINKRVGINKSLPTETLDVSGNVLVSSSLSAKNNIGVGTTTGLPGTSAFTIHSASSALSFTMTDAFIRINIGAKQYALPLYQFTQ